MIVIFRLADDASVLSKLLHGAHLFGQERREVLRVYESRMRGIVTRRQQFAKAVVAEPRVLYGHLRGAIGRQVDDARALVREDGFGDFVGGRAHPIYPAAFKGLRVAPRLS